MDSETCEKFRVRRTLQTSGAGRAHGKVFGAVGNGPVREIAVTEEINKLYTDREIPKKKDIRLMFLSENMGDWYE